MANRDEPDDEREEIKQLLGAIKKTIDKASVLDGGFEKVASKINDIQLSVSELKNTSAKTERAVDGLNKEMGILSKSIYDPDTGLYARIKTVDYKLNANNEATNDLCEDIGKSYRSIKENETNILKFDKRLAEIEREHNSLRKITGSDHEDLKLILKTRKNFNKVFWVFILGVIGSFAKTIIDYFVK